MYQECGRDGGRTGRGGDAKGEGLGLYPGVVRGEPINQGCGKGRRGAKGEGRGWLLGWSHNSVVKGCGEGAGGGRGQWCDG